MFKLACGYGQRRQSVSDAALDGLAQEVDYRAREVIQEALKFALHAKRTSLTTDAVDRAYV